MKKLPPIWLLVCLMMLPQIAETIYSPILPSISQAFYVSVVDAGQTLSIYFIAFAVGVVFWGRMADIIGRRSSMLLGLLCYALACIVAALTNSFSILLAARAMSAFGLAVGSVISQTILRDGYSGKELAQTFNIMGLAISISPVIGLLAGTGLNILGGYRIVFIMLAVLALFIFIICYSRLNETQNELNVTDSFFSVAKKMVMDTKIWLSACLVAGFNLLIFVYYQQGAFFFESLGYSSQQFGYSGIVLALGTFGGGILNRRLLSMGYTSYFVIVIAGVISFLGGLCAYQLSNSLWLLAAVLVIVCSFGLAIPNILSVALNNYKTSIGSAGAIFGLFYYLMLGLGLNITAYVNHLSQSLLFTSAFIMIIAGLLFWLRNKQY
ncbi:MFS transporter [Photobacterium damselae]|uniref:MFS transporter n=1 Tax=Photobacterium damselae TaxID=38293 RepID=UPI0013022CCF|nr:MFS transporter [Photobacterium damselae]